MKVKPSLLLVCAALFAVSCKDGDDTTPTDTQEPLDTYPTPLDGDGDGVTTENGDCDDADAAVYPGRTEDCDGADNNCNDLIDEGFGDSDGDKTADCLDAEDCDGADNDGDGNIDEGFPDADGDGVADCVGTEICDGLDNNGDGLVDEGFDVDGDGVTTCESDCDDTNADAYPGAEEVAGDSVDNDCDSLVDESTWSGGDLAIVEIMSNPSRVTDPKGEYIELYNASETDLDINGLELYGSDGDYHQITATSAVIVPAGTSFLLGLNADPKTNGGISVDYVYSGVSLSNEVDDLTISMGGVVIDSVTWDDGATMPDKDGAAMTVDNWFLSSTGNDLANHWCNSTVQWGATSDYGTPGEYNELCSTTDHDSDGFTKDDGDCDDSDADIYPNAPEKDADKDNDCDGEIELMPVASATYTSGSSLESCDILYLDGSGSYDQDTKPSGGAIVYKWELTSAPASSATTSADIDTTTSQKPTFTPDVAGTYVFTLTVNDGTAVGTSVGGADSVPVTLSVTITGATSNTTPVANAGSDQSASSTVSCQAYSYGAYYTCDACSDTSFTMSGSGTDAESDDHMTFAWSISSGSSYGTLSDSAAQNPTVTVTGPTPGSDLSTSTNTVTLDLKVTDCYGATSSADSVTLTYSCTGT